MSTPKVPLWKRLIAIIVLLFSFENLIHHMLCAPTYSFWLLACLLGIVWAYRVLRGTAWISSPETSKDAGAGLSGKNPMSKNLPHTEVQFAESRDKDDQIQWNGAKNGFLLSKEEGLDVDEVRRFSSLRARGEGGRVRRMVADIEAACERNLRDRWLTGRQSRTSSPDLTASKTTPTVGWVSAPPFATPVTKPPVMDKRLHYEWSSGGNESKIFVSTNYEKDFPPIQHEPSHDERIHRRPATPFELFNSDSKSSSTAGISQGDLRTEKSQRQLNDELKALTPVSENPNIPLLDDSTSKTKTQNVKGVKKVSFATDEPTTNHETDNGLSLTWIKDHCIACPGCGVWISKIYSSQNITCICGTHFCWLCEKAKKEGGGVGDCPLHGREQKHGVWNFVDEEFEGEGKGKGKEMFWY